MTNRLSDIVVAMALLFAATAAHGQDGPVGFQTPSKNIACQLSVGDGQSSLRCDLLKVAAKPSRPRNCELDFGDAFEMATKGEAAPTCHGDTVADPKLPVLAYGEAWQHDGFTCRSAPSGLTCTNGTQHGFSLSRATQKVF
jgi:hypothetical protein